VKRDETMLGQNPTILIFGARIGPDGANDVIPRSDRASVETIKANLGKVMESVSDLIHATQKNLGDVQVAHVDVGVAISPDGSVGLVGTGSGTGVGATLKMRLQFRKPYRAGF